MYQIGDLVQYGMSGVCRISEITENLFDGKKVKYYVLTSVGNKDSVVYVPSFNEKLVAKMRKVLTPQEIYDIIEALPDEKIMWIDDDAKRKEYFNKTVKSGDRLEIMKIIKTLYLHKHKLQDEGKKLHIADEQIFRESEDLLYDEFSIVLNIEKEDVLPFIMKKLKAQQKAI